MKELEARIGQNLGNENFKVRNPFLSESFPGSNELSAKMELGSNTYDAGVELKSGLKSKATDYAGGTAQLTTAPEGYEAAGAELVSPIASSEENIADGALLYGQMCTQCHGAEGKGDGAISRNVHIAGIPDYSTKLKDLPEGKMYHTLQYGKGLMGSHASQLSQKERWLIIEYIKTLQGNDVASSETENND